MQGKQAASHPPHGRTGPAERGWAAALCLNVGGLWQWWGLVYTILTYDRLLEWEMMGINRHIGAQMTAKQPSGRALKCLACFIFWSEVV